MADLSLVQNFAALHPPALRAAIDAADAETLAKIDADLAREGWALGGAMRSRIAQWRAALGT
jgi:hypothetical protein